ncbi:hypothetical protein KX841_31300, partial [Pseudomonas aeruginosa]|nr:hypothetical protein [Pseudomonas aeruginosa]
MGKSILEKTLTRWPVFVDHFNQTSWQLSHTFYNDSFSHKELGVTVGGLNTDTINSAVNGRWDGQYGNVYATV